jgi:hypothetical protein
MTHSRSCSNAASPGETRTLGNLGRQFDVKLVVLEWKMNKGVEGLGRTGACSAVKVCLLLIDKARAKDKNYI